MRKTSGYRLKTEDSSLASHVSSAGFTLIELLTVIVIIAILAALSVGGFRYAMTKSAESQAQSEIKAMDSALEAYKLDLGYYPPGANNGVTLNEAKANSKKLFQALSGNSAGTSLVPDAGKSTYFSGFREGKNGNIELDGGVYCIFDPFGNPYNYIQPGLTNKFSYDLWSYGKDGSSRAVTGDEADDIANWKF